MNEYHEYVTEELKATNTFRGQQWFGERQRLVEKYGWAIPNEDVLTYLQQFDSILDIGCGKAYWSYLLNERDSSMSIECIDRDLPEDTWVDRNLIRETSIYELPATYIEGRVVLMIWPPYDDDMAAYVAGCSPNHICYVGEPRGGCTANNKFFDRVETEYGLVGAIDIPSYVGVNDKFYHYVRNI